MAVETKSNENPFSQFNNWSGSEEGFKAFIMFFFENSLSDPLSGEPFFTGKKVMTFINGDHYITSYSEETAAAIFPKQDLVQNIAVQHTLEDLKSLYIHLCVEQKQKMALEEFSIDHQRNIDALFQEQEELKSRIQRQTNELLNLQRQKDQMAQSNSEHEERAFSAREKVTRQTAALASLEKKLKEQELNQKEAIRRLEEQYQKEIDALVLKQNITLMQYEATLSEQGEEKKELSKKTNQLEEFRKKQRELATARTEQEKKILTFTRRIKELEKQLTAKTQRSELEELKAQKKILQASNDEKTKVIKKLRSEKSTQKLKKTQIQISANEDTKEADITELKEDLSTLTHTASLPDFDLKVEDDSAVALPATKIFTEQEAIEFIQENLPIATASQRFMLAGTLEFVALALDLAVRYITHSGCTPQYYCRNFDSYESQAEIAAAQNSKEQTIIKAAFLHTWNYFNQNYPAVLQILCAYTYLDASDDISIDWFEHLEKLPTAEGTPSYFSSPEIQDAINILKNYGLLLPESDGSSIRINPLIQPLVHEQLSPSEQQAYIERINVTSIKFAQHVYHLSLKMDPPFSQKREQMLKLLRVFTLEELQGNTMHAEEKEAHAASVSETNSSAKSSIPLSFLTKTINDKELESLKTLLDEEELSLLMRNFHHLLIPIHFATNYLLGTGCTPEEYFLEFASRQLELAKDTSTTPKEQVALITFSFIWDFYEQNYPAAIGILCACAYLGKLSTNWIETELEKPEEEKDAYLLGNFSLEEVNEAIASLEEYGLLERKDDDFIEISDSTKALIHLQLSTLNQHEEKLDAVSLWLMEFTPEANEDQCSDQSSEETWHVFQSYLTRLISYYEQYSCVTSNLVIMLSMLGTTHYGIGEFEEAQKKFSNALTILEEKHMADQPNLIIDILLKLTDVCDVLKNTEGKIEYLLRTVAIIEKYQLKDNQAAHTYLYLGKIYNASGDFHKGCLYLLKAVPITQNVPGYSAAVFTNLSMSYYGIGKFESALNNAKKVLEILAQEMPALQYTDHQWITALQEYSFSTTPTLEYAYCYLMVHLHHLQKKPALDYFEIGITLGKLSIICNALKQFRLHSIISKQATCNLLKALEILEKEPTPNDTKIGTALTYLAMTIEGDDRAQEIAQHAYNNLMHLKESDPVREECIWILDSCFSDDSHKAISTLKQLLVSLGEETTANSFSSALSQEEKNPADPVSQDYAVADALVGPAVLTFDVSAQAANTTVATPPQNLQPLVSTHLLETHGFLSSKRSANDGQVKAEQKESSSFEKKSAKKHHKNGKRR